MQKTEQEIEEDVFVMVRDSVLGRVIRGGVYRPGMRDDAAKGEDIVVKYIAGRGEQWQVSEVVVNVYVPDVMMRGGKLVRDMKRIKELEKLINEMVWNDKSHYQLEKADTPKVIHHEEIDQHCINARLRLMWVAW